MRKITIIVPNGRAAVELYATATVFRKLNVKNNGPENRLPVNTKIFT
jgi:hypothetical protein